MEANLEQQADELEALQAIYGDDFAWAVESGEGQKSFFMTVPGDFCLQLLVHLPATYPSQEPPIAEVYESFGVTTAERDELVADLHAIYERSNGQVCLYEWIESAREKFGAYTSFEPESLATAEVDWDFVAHEAPEALVTLAAPFLASIKTGEPITDRKSTFQAHAVAVTSVQQVNEFVEFLLQDRKIARATHNMLAYRIVAGTNVIKDCDEDGEHGAGNKMSHLLEMLHAENVAVVVTRWYGGIQLGPDRFKHIANATRNVLETYGFIAAKTKK
ncbi:impact-like protein [Achlya hypogyna]|uniref:Impact-like protein n=1 Tax=Achlya hypogyna TaxID=1202772 RepID=A0A1V9YXL3_ACHHY|nr:impact-like protein [Achlya hypogyna]